MDLIRLPIIINTFFNDTNSFYIHDRLFVFLAFEIICLLSFIELH